MALQANKGNLLQISSIKILLPSGNYRNSCGGGGGTPYNGLYGEAPPERGTFFTLQVYERVGISRVEVYERLRESFI